MKAILLVLLVAAVTPVHAAPATQKSVADLDHAVLETVFADLLALDKSPVAMRDKPPETIRVAPDPAAWPVTAERVLQRHEKKLWEALAPADLDAAKEAAADLLRRHEKHDTFASFASDNPRVRRAVTATQPTQPADFNKRPIHAWSPGYTSDRQFAVVHLSIPWSIHHADATYLLRWDEPAGKWTIVLRQFVYYV